jgi:hypothetical protein
MLVRVLNDNTVVRISVGYTTEQEQEFIVKNPKGGFMLIDSFPEYNGTEVCNYKWNGIAIVVDDEANAADAQDVINQEARDYLASTDWMLSRELDGGVAMTAEVKQLRAEARARVI